MTESNDSVSPVDVSPPEGKHSSTPEDRRGEALSALVGQTLDGSYQIDELIGGGGMGSVFRARQLRLRRTVALKIPHPELAERRPDFLLRFEREALTMAKLLHENVVQVFDVHVGHGPGTYSYLAMEYVEGPVLDEFLRQQENDLTVAAVCNIFRDVARGLDAAHDRGIVHRDIKPNNIIITMPQRVPKIMDFGIARAEMDDIFRTQEGMPLGTPAYMAPEQVKGEDVTPAADIYSFTVMLYSMLTRSLPFDARGSAGFLNAHVSQPPLPACLRNPRLPRSVQSALEAGLAKSPDQRPATATEVIEAVAKALEPLKNLSYASLLRPSPEALRIDDADVAAYRAPTEPPPDPAAGEGATPGEKAQMERVRGHGGAVALGILILVAFALVISAIFRDFPGAPQPASKAQPAESSTAAVAPEVETEPATAALLEETSPEPEESPAPAEPAPDQPEEAAAPITPVPAPTPAVTAAPPPEALWDPERTPPLQFASQIARVRDQVDAVIDAGIERPAFYGNFRAPENALAAVQGPAAAELLTLLRRFAQTHEDLALSLEIDEDQSLFWSDRARLKLGVSLAGRPRGHADRQYRPVLYAPKNLLELDAVRGADGWSLIELRGDLPEPTPAPAPSED